MPLNCSDNDDNNTFAGKMNDLTNASCEPVSSVKCNCVYSNCF